MLPDCTLLYHRGSTTEEFSVPGYVATSTDCDDGDAAIHPGAEEIPGDEFDQDCDGFELCYVDVDGDGYTTDERVTVESLDDLLCDAAGEALSEAPAGDCDDEDADFHPGAVEEDCTDPNDYNCDGSTGYADVDADGWAACEDCDDSDPSINPDAEDLPDDGIDQDCDGEDATVDDSGYPADTGDGGKGSRCKGCSGSPGGAWAFAVAALLAATRRRGRGHTRLRRAQGLSLAPTGARIR